jgi:hypothetical protein
MWDGELDGWAGVLTEVEKVTRIFFLRRKGNYMKVQFLQKDPETKPEIQRRPLDPDEEDELDAAGGAPPPLHPLMAWIRCSPSADGKSPVASS